MLIDNEGNNAYSYACRTGNIKIMEYLQNKDVNVLSNNHNCLFFAAQGTRKNQNSVDLYKYLERIGVNLKTLNDKSENVLHYLTKRSKDTVLLSFFIQKDVDINHEDKNGKTPISNAIERNRLPNTNNLHRFLKNMFGSKTELLRTFPNCSAWFCIEKSQNIVFSNNKEDI